MKESTSSIYFSKLKLIIQMVFFSLLPLVESEGHVYGIMGTILSLICKNSFWSIDVTNVIYQLAKRAWKIVPEAIYVLSIPLIVK